MLHDITIGDAHVLYIIFNIICVVVILTKCQILPSIRIKKLCQLIFFSDLRFHHVHGKNARIVNNGLTAIRPRPLAEFNDGIVFSSRPLRDGELFEVTLDSMVDRWSGSIELGVTAVRPDDIDLPSTATDLSRDTWMLSGSSIMENGTTIKNNYALDLDTLSAGIRVGVMRTTDKNLEFFKDGVSQGLACVITNPNIFAVVDLYGQCAQVSIPCASPMAPLSNAQICTRSDTSQSLQAPSVVQHAVETDLHRFFESHTKGLTLIEGGRIAIRGRDVQHCVAFSATPLAQDETFEISIVSLVPHIAGSLAIGVTPSIPNPPINVLPADCCYLTGNELHWKGKLIQLFAPNLNWLRIGDRIGFLLTHENSLKAFINGEEVALNFPQLPDSLHVVVELGGFCSSVHVTSRKVPTSPLINAPLQDSLEIVLENENSSDIPTVSEEHASIENTNMPIKYEFHENHGRNIEIMSDKTVARRVASYNQGLVIIHPALQMNQVIQISIAQLDSRWQSSLMCGIVCGAPDRLNLPGTALAFKGCSCIIANDWVSINGLKSRSNYGIKLNNLNIGSRIALVLTENGIQMFIDGNSDEILPWTPNAGQPYYAVFDLYGQCQQIKILNEVEDEVSTSSPQDCEKADLESCEKERSIPNLTLQLPTTSCNIANNIPKISPVTPSRLIPCPYQDTCEKFKKSLLLPDEFFTSDDPICYCNSCFKLKRHETDIYKDDFIQGWVKFTLRNFSNLQTDKWHNAYYGTKLSTIRCILDRGQPLTKNQLQYSNLIGQRAEDVQVVFSPSLEHCSIEHFKLDNGKIVWAAFQILVKPGAYSLSRDVPEWSTKETGALTLNALLLKIH